MHRKSESGAHMKLYTNRIGRGMATRFLLTGLANAVRAVDIVSTFEGNRAGPGDRLKRVRCPWGP